MNADCCSLNVHGVVVLLVGGGDTSTLELFALRGSVDWEPKRT